MKGEGTKQQLRNFLVPLKRRVDLYPRCKVWGRPENASRVSAPDVRSGNRRQPKEADLKRPLNEALLTLTPGWNSIRPTEWTGGGAEGKPRGAPQDWNLMGQEGKGLGQEKGFLESLFPVELVRRTG
ncbi:hypothetical protein H1C71_039158 [Ictidomys tridecemlineatus]|nr:hypothetical protein H1C71_039158 [Ictidomys tridecemlineatus]